MYQLHYLQFIYSYNATLTKQGIFRRTCKRKTNFFLLQFLIDWILLGVLKCPKILKKYLELFYIISSTCEYMATKNKLKNKLSKHYARREER